MQEPVLLKEPVHKSNFFMNRISKLSCVTVPLGFPIIWNLFHRHPVTSHCKSHSMHSHVHRGTVSWLTVFLVASANTGTASASPQGSHHGSGSLFFQSPSFPNPDKLWRWATKPGYIFQFIIIPTPHSSFLTSVKEPLLKWLL